MKAAESSGMAIDAVVVMRVRGVKGLRVVDCSVMPTQMSGSTTDRSWR